MPEPTVTKSTVQKYSIHNEHSWALIFVDESSGTVMIHSDYGDWGYHWTHHGCPSIKHFLVQCDTDYLCGKFTAGADVFDSERTFAAIRQEIEERRRQGDLTIGKADDARGELDDIAQDSDRCDDFLAAVERTDHLSEILADPYEYICKKPLPAFMNFMERIWPTFTAELKREIAV